MIVSPATAASTAARKLPAPLSATVVTTKPVAARSKHEDKLLALLGSPANQPSAYERALRVTDYIASMTDSYAVTLYRRLKGISLPGSGR